MLHKFIPPQQLTCINQNIEESEEAQFFVDKLQELTSLINSMPVTYETEDIKNPIAQLHYFRGGADVYIIEKDIEDEQLQAFGYVNLGLGLGDGYEAGYISIKELLENGFELDLYFDLKPINTLINKGVQQRKQLLKK